MLFLRSNLLFQGFHLLLQAHVFLIKIYIPSKKTKEKECKQQSSCDNQVDTFCSIANLLVALVNEALTCQQDAHWPQHVKWTAIFIISTCYGKWVFNELGNGFLHVPQNVWANKESTTRSCYGNCCMHPNYTSLISLLAFDLCAFKHSLHFVSAGCWNCDSWASESPHSPFNSFTLRYSSDNCSCAKAKHKSEFRTAKAQDSHQTNHRTMCSHVSRRVINTIISNAP